MKRFLTLAAILSLLLSGCSGQYFEAVSKQEREKSRTNSNEISEFRLTSPAFKDGERIPVRFCLESVRGGKNLSPPLEWTEPPEGTKSFALICIDNHPVAGGWIHWAVVNIPASWRKLDEGASGTEKINPSVELKNSYGFRGWGGPCPPEGSGIHSYEFHLLAMPEEKIAIPATPEITGDFLESLRKNCLGEAVLTGSFSR